MARIWDKKKSSNPIKEILGLQCRKFITDVPRCTSGVFNYQIKRYRLNVIIISQSNETVKRLTNDRTFVFCVFCVSQKCRKTTASHFRLDSRKSYRNSSGLSGFCTVNFVEVPFISVSTSSAPCRLDSTRLRMSRMPSPVPTGAALRS